MITYDEPGLSYDDPLFLYDGGLSSSIIRGTPIFLKGVSARKNVEIKRPTDQISVAIASKLMEAPGKQIEVRMLVKSSQLEVRAKRSTLQYEESNSTLEVFCSPILSEVEKIVVSSSLEEVKKKN